MHFGPWIEIEWNGIKGKESRYTHIASYLHTTLWQIAGNEKKKEKKHVPKDGPLKTAEVN